MKTLTKLTTVLLLLALTACGGASDTEAPAPAAAPADTTAEAPPAARMEDGVQVAEIEAGQMGYQPGRIALQAGVPARLVFTRTAESPCLEQVQVPAFDVEPTDLPMNQPVAIEFTPQETGEYTFICGMDMVHGTLVVKS